MSDNDPKMDPQKGVDAVLELTQEVAKRTEANDLDGLDNILDRLGEIADATGLDVPGLQDRIASIKGQSRKAADHVANTDAAMWAGDLDRARMLLDEGPNLSMSALGIDELVPDEDMDDIGSEDQLFDPENLEEVLTGMGIDPGDFDEGQEIDLYEDIAAGTPEAIEELIASGEDPNVPSGPSRHTALLAALDAPGRNAQTIAKLIEAGAKADIIHVFGDNAISWAMGYHHPFTVTAESERELIVLLAKNGADPNHVTGTQWTAAQRAIIQGNEMQLGAIIAAGADASINAFETFEPTMLAGATPVMLAAPKPASLQILLDAGIDAGAKADDGRDPLTWIAEMARAARQRVDDDDPWTLAHAEALETSLAILKAHLTS